jgi:hypothetical protein
MATEIRALADRAVDAAVGHEPFYVTPEEYVALKHFMVPDGEGKCQKWEDLLMAVVYERDLSVPLGEVRVVMFPADALAEIQRLREALRRVVAAADDVEYQSGETQRLADITQIAIEALTQW